MNKEALIQQNPEAFEKTKGRCLKMPGFDAAHFERELGFAIRIVNNNEALQKCDAIDLLGCILSAVECGLTLNPQRKHAYLVPFKGKPVLMPGWHGLVFLLQSEGCVQSISAEVVYSGCEFDMEMGSDRFVKHKPYYMLNSAKGDPRLVYAMAYFTDGGWDVEKMDMEQIYKIRDISASYKIYIANKEKYKKGIIKWEPKKPIWEEWKEEMMKKTVVRRLAERLSRNVDNQKLANAIKADNHDFDLEGVDKAVDYTKMIMSCKDSADLLELVEKEEGIFKMEPTRKLVERKLKEFESAK